MEHSHQQMGSQSKQRPLLTTKKHCLKSELQSYKLPLQVTDTGNSPFCHPMRIPVKAECLHFDKFEKKVVKWICGTGSYVQ